MLLLFMPHDDFSETWIFSHKFTAKMINNIQVHRLNFARAWLAREIYLLSTVLLNSKI